MPAKKYSSKEEAKKAQKEKIRIWRLKNKDRIKSKVTEYQKKNQDIVQKSHKKYQVKNKDLILERAKKSNIKRIIKNKYANADDEFLRRKIEEYKPIKRIPKPKFTKVSINKYANADDEFLRRKIEEYKPIKRIPKPKFTKVSINKCPNCNKLFSTKKQGNRKFCSQNCSLQFKRSYKFKRKKRLYTTDQRKKWNLKYYSTEKGQITHLWDTLRKRIKKYTFSKVQTARKDMDKLTGCSKFFILKFIESKFYDHPVTNKKMTWANSNEWHLDHITPLKILNPKNEEHFKIANHFSNLQPMWADENLKKGANVTPGYGVAHLKRKYKTLQSLGDLTKISNEKEAKAIIIQASKVL